jgi:hypothetical protein
MAFASKQKNVFLKLTATYWLLLWLFYNLNIKSVTFIQSIGYGILKRMDRPGGVAQVVQYLS